MVECDLCKVWQHIACVGWEPEGDCQEFKCTWCCSKEQAAAGSEKGACPKQPGVPADVVVEAAEAMDTHRQAPATKTVAAATTTAAAAAASRPSASPPISCTSSDLLQGFLPPEQCPSDPFGPDSGDLEDLGDATLMGDVVSPSHGKQEHTAQCMHEGGVAALLEMEVDAANPAELEAAAAAATEAGADDPAKAAAAQSAAASKPSPKRQKLSTTR